MKGEEGNRGGGRRGRREERMRGGGDEGRRGRGRRALFFMWSISCSLSGPLGFPQKKPPRSLKTGPYR